MPEFDPEADASKTELERAAAWQLKMIEELRAVIEQLNAANEELERTNQELIASNGALRQAQSSLTTINVELREVNSDLAAILNGLNIPIILIGADLRIRRFTNAAARTLQLNPADIGKSAAQLTPQMNLPNLGELIGEAIRRLEPGQRQIQASDGRTYTLCICPCRDLNNNVCVLLTMFDLNRGGPPFRTPQDCALME